MPEFRNAFEYAAIGMSLAALDGRWLDVNPAFCALTGYSKDELLGRRFQDLTDPGDRDREREAVRRLVAGEIPSYDLEKRYMHKEGQPVWVHATCAIVPDDVGQPRYLVQQAQDISERKRAEAVLRERDLLKKVLAILPVGVWILDKTGRIVEGNLAAHRIWGGARYVGLKGMGEYRGWWLKTREPIAADAWPATRAITHGETATGDLIEIETFDGHRKIIRNAAMPLRDADGAIEGAVVVNEDITALKTTESALREIQDVLSERVDELEGLLSEVQALQGILPICAYCKNIRNDENYWQRIEEYISEHSDTLFTHSICPKCVERLLHDMGSEGPREL